MVKNSRIRKVIHRMPLNMPTDTMQYLQGNVSADERREHGTANPATANGKLENIIVYTLSWELKI